MEKREELPKRPTPEQWEKVSKAQQTFRREIDATQKPVEPGRHEESFPLTGFFDKVKLDEFPVGKHLVFKVPSIKDMKTLYKATKKGGYKERMSNIEKDRQASGPESMENVVYWVERGMETLRAADYLFTVGKESAAEETLEVARWSFDMANETSEALGMRYFPEHYRDRNEPSNDEPQERSG